jgi:hypothetical protein
MRSTCSRRAATSTRRPEAQQFVLDYLTAATMHEVGHTLGLRHNFRASRIHSDATVRSGVHRTHALTGSVMELRAVNLRAPASGWCSPFQTPLGPYDYWAIEVRLQAARSRRPGGRAAQHRGAQRRSRASLRHRRGQLLGIDPDALHFDLGNDVAAFAKKRIAIARDLFKRQETARLRPGPGLHRAARARSLCVGDVARAVGVLGRQIGGCAPCATTPAAAAIPLQPVSPAQQREALDVIARGLFAADSLVVSRRRCSAGSRPIRGARRRRLRGERVSRTDFSLSQRVLRGAAHALGQLMSDAVAARIVDSQDKAANAADAFQLSELYGACSARSGANSTSRATDCAGARASCRSPCQSPRRCGAAPGAASRAERAQPAAHPGPVLLTQIQSALGPQLRCRHPRICRTVPIRWRRPLGPLAAQRG